MPIVKHESPDFGFQKDCDKTDETSKPNDELIFEYDAPEEAEETKHQPNLMEIYQQLKKQNENEMKADPLNHLNTIVDVPDSSVLDYIANDK